METVFDAGVLLLCVGALVLVALVAFVFRAMTRSSRSDATMTGEPVDTFDPVDPRNIGDAENFGGVPATGAREYDTERGVEVTNQDRVDEDINLADPDLDRDRPPYDRDTGDIDDGERRRRDDDDIL